MNPFFVLFEKRIFLLPEIPFSLFFMIFFELVTCFSQK
jgi:hypothetical protein